MINFFRKIRQRLLSDLLAGKAGNKLSKYIIYAFGEIILVVIGILIALAINNWNIKNSDKIRETKYLKNIKLDLQKDLANLEYNLNFRKNKYMGTEKLIKQVNGMPIDDLTELTKNVVTTLMAERFTPNNTTYTELSNSGNLNLISNDSIKTLLLDLENLYKINIFGIEHETFDYSEYISKPIFKNISTTQILPIFNETSTIEDQQITIETFDALFQSLEYKNGLEVTNLITKEIIPLYENIESISKKIIEIIDKEIKN